MLSNMMRSGAVAAFLLTATVASAVITPSQDPFTLFGMAGPMVIFYFGAIGVGKLLKK